MKGHLWQKDTVAFGSYKVNKHSGFLLNERVDKVVMLTVLFGRCETWPLYRRHVPQLEKSLTRYIDISSVVVNRKFHLCVSQ